MNDRPPDTPRTALPFSAPHLSHSRVNRYLHCPEQYRLYYLEGLRPRVPSASLVFGQIVHQALAHLFQSRGDPVQFFLESWQGVSDLEIQYSRSDSCEKLRASGEALLTKFVEEELPRISDVEASERPFTLNVTSLGLPFVGVIDLLAAVDGERTVVDFKTSGSRYAEHQARMSDQLTAYHLAEPEVERSALCVLVKTKEPQIEWQATSREPSALADYLVKAGLVAHEIEAGRFFKRPGMWCSWCDFLPICAGQHAKAEETLVQAA